MTRAQGLDAETLAQDLRSTGEYVAIPEYAYDCHTREGKKRSKTKANFFKVEQAALEPFQPGLFDHLIDCGVLVGQTGKQGYDAQPCLQQNV